MQIRALLEALVHLELLGTFNKLGQPRLRSSDQYSYRILSALSAMETLRKDMPTEMAMQRWPAAEQRDDELPNHHVQHETYLRMQHQESSSARGSCWLCAVQQWDHETCQAWLTVRHDDCVVLRSQVRLDTFATCTASLVNVLASAIAAYKADSFDGRMVADGVDSRYGAMNYVQHASGKPCTLAQLRDDHGGTWVAF